MLEPGDARAELLNMATHFDALAESCSRSPGNTSPSHHDNVQSPSTILQLILTF
jgi:hypothetical protein